MDRISNYQIFSRATQEMMMNTLAVNRTQEQISTGKRVLTPADDPIASARILQLDEDIALMDQYKKNSQALDARLQLEEGILAGIEEVIQRTRELTVSSGNGARNYEDRQAIAVEIRERLKEMIDLFNSRDPSGEYLFSGFAGATKPFEENPGGGYSYKGDEGQRMLQISQTVTLAASDSGKKIFMDIEAIKPSFLTFANSTNLGNPPGVISAGITTNQEAFEELYPDDAVITFNNELDVVPTAANFTVRNRRDGRVIDGLNNVRFVEGQSIPFAGIQVSINGQPKPGDTFIVETSPKQGLIATVEKLLYGLETIQDSADSQAVITNMVDDTLSNLDFAMVSVSETRAKIGARMNTNDDTVEMHADLKLVAQEIRSDLRDLDFAEAVSRLQLESFILEAAQQSYTKVSTLSLFNYIR